MRIITGKYKGRHFDIPRTFKARPTTDFAKENIFNVLTQYIDFDGATALDLFSGTGSITLELLSRGCRQVVCVEMDRDHHRFIQECLKKLQGEKNVQRSMSNDQCSMFNGQCSMVNGQCSMVNGQCSMSNDQCSMVNGQCSMVNGQCIRGDVFRFLKSCRQQFDFIFADPPYALKELPTIPDIIFEKNLLTEDGIFVFEHGKDYDFSQHPHFVEHRQYGSVNFSLFTTAGRAGE